MAVDMGVTPQTSGSMTLSYREIKSNSRLLAPVVRKPQLSRTKRSPVASNTRASHSKVRTGCRTCKARHVKCDELKPECIKCTSTGRKCDGFESGKDNASSQPKALMAISNFVQYTPNVGIPGDDHDRRTFHYFRCRSSSAMFRYFESSCFEADFWDGVVLQISHSHPTVRHAVLALGALYEEYDISRPSRGNTPVDGIELHNDFSLKQYNKAVRLLAADLSAEDPPLEGILASCLIFICLEFLRNNPRTALSHLQAGLRILNEASATEVDSSSSTVAKFPSRPKNQQIDRSLSVLFSRLNSQAAFHGCPNSGFTAVEHATLPPVVLARFYTIGQARGNLEDIFGCLFQMLRQVRLTEEPPTAPTDADMVGVCHLSFGPMLQNYVDLFQQWHAALDDLVARLVFEQRLEKGQELSILLMKLHYQVVILALHTVNLREIGFDAHFSSFKDILAHATLVFEGMGPECSELPTLSVDMGVMAPLFYLLWKCRDPEIRLPALELLRRAPVREGIWRRESTIELVEWKIAREEQEALNLGWQPGEVLPEGARTFWELLKEVEGDDGKMVTMVTFRRRRGDMLEVVEEVADLGIEMGEVV